MKQDGQDTSATGRLHSFESFGTVDGPGIRFVVFMQGCRFRCLYCHNPDTWCLAPAAYEMSPRQVFQRMIKQRPFYRNGGVTVSGGEPLLQPAFLKEFFRLCRAEGIHTALDTTGCVLSDEVREALAYTDLVLLDIKSIDPEIHRNLTGQQLQPTLDFAAYLSEQGIPVWIRYVLVPGITDDDELIDRHAAHAADLGNVEMVEILPFHKMAAAKYEKLGIPFPLMETDPPAPQRIENAKRIFRKRGLTVK